LYFAIYRLGLFVKWRKSLIDTTIQVSNSSESRFYPTGKRHQYQPNLLCQFVQTRGGISPHQYVIQQRSGTGESDVVENGFGIIAFQTGFPVKAI